MNKADKYRQNAEEAKARAERSIAMLTSRRGFELQKNG
jgi:hypothetical protein